MVKVDLGAAKEQVNSIKKICQSLNDQVNQVQDAVEQFIDNDDLKGKGYQSAKEFGATVVINAWRAVRVAFETVGNGASKMIEDYQSTVDSKSWSDEELDEKIRTLENDRNQLSSQLAALLKVANTLQHSDKKLKQKMGQSLNRSIQEGNQSIQTLDAQINHFKEIKQHLHEFDAKSSSFMTDAQSLISEAMTGISQLNNGLNPKTGESTLPDSSQLTWIDDVNEKASKYDSRKEQFIDVMSDTYGLDDEDAKDLYALQQGIEKYAKKHHKDPMWVLSEYNRIIASLGGYSTDSKIGKLEWTQAGCVTIIQAKKLCKKYGLSSEQINKLSGGKDLEKGLLYQQHKNANVKKDLAHESVIIASYSHHEQYHGDMSNKQKIGMLLDNIAVDIGGLPTGIYTVKNTPNIDNKSSVAEDETTLFNDNVSYRGDIMSGSKKASNSDFSSDVDAENIYNRAKKTSSVRGALDTSIKYNNEIETGEINRKKEFLKSHGGWNSVKEAIDSWTPEDIPLRGRATEQEIKEAKENFKKFLDKKPTGIESLFN